nr:hypothetical protein [Tanacetum cinerariifolium]
MEDSYVAIHQRKENGRMMLESIENGPLVYPTIEENGQIHKKKYAKLTEQEKLQDDSDVQETNIVLQGLPPDMYSIVNHCQAAKDIWDRGQSFVGTGTKGNATRFGRNNVAGQVRVVKCYNYQGEGHMARQCTQPKRPRNSAWFKEKTLLVQAHESGQVLDEEQLSFLTDPGIIESQVTQITILQNVVFHTDDLDAYDSDCDDISSSKAVLMANLSSYNSDILFEVMKVKTTSDTITEGSWGFEHTKNVFLEEVIPFINSLRASFKDFNNGLHSKLNEVKMLFNQMKASAEQCSVDKKYFNIQKKKKFLIMIDSWNHIICQDVMNIMMHADFVPVNVLPANNKCRMHDNLEIERLEQENNHLFELLLSQDIVHIYVNSLPTRTNCREMQQSFIHEYNENLMLKAKLAKRTRG